MDWTGSINPSLLQADEEATNDLNGNSDQIDLTPGGAGVAAMKQAPSRRPPQMDMNMYATRKTIAQGMPPTSGFRFHSLSPPQASWISD